MAKKKPNPKTGTVEYKKKEVSFIVPDGANFGEKFVRTLLTLIANGAYKGNALNFKVSKTEGDKITESYAVTVMIAALPKEKKNG